MHIAIEGFDGVGKSTVAGLLAEKLCFTLVEKPLKYLFDPGGSDKNYIRIRNYINEISPGNRPLSAFFYGFGNIYLYEKFKGQNIITDRHILSNYAWSGSSESEPVFEAVYKSIGAPTYTFIIYAECNTIYDRLKNRNVNDSDLSKVNKSEDIYNKMVTFANKYNMPYSLIDTTLKSQETVLQIMIQELSNKGIINA